MQVDTHGGPLLPAAREGPAVRGLLDRVLAPEAAFPEARRARDDRRRRLLAGLVDGRSQSSFETPFTLPRVIDPHQARPRVQVDPELMYLVVLPGADEALLRLRAEGAIDDDVLREVERELDLEERRMDA